MSAGNSKVVDTTVRRRTQRQAQADQTRRTLLNAAVKQFSERHFDEVATSHTTEWTCQLLGLDADRPALRLSLRACIGAVDEATVYWLKTGHPFERDAVVELLIEFLITALEGAARLDSNIDSTAAIALLR